MKNQTKIRGAKLQILFDVLILTLLAAVGWNVTVARAESRAERFDQQMQPILKSYLQIGDALASDSLTGVRKNAQSIVKLAAALDSASVSGEHAAHYRNVPADLEKAARTLSKAEGVEKARESFKKLSQPMAMWVSMSKPKDVDVVYCSMSKASWVQKHGKVRNPYHGAKMLECGEVVGGENHQGHGH